MREGLLYSKLPRRKMQADALLSSCWDFARRYARSPEHELELCDWTDQLFGGPGYKETEVETRLRYAACLLADIGWRAHPDYRAERSLGMISQAAFVGIDHPGGFSWPSLFSTATKARKWAMASCICLMTTR